MVDFKALNAKNAASFLDSIKETTEGLIEIPAYLQVINGKSPNPAESGLYILAENAEKVGFKPDARWTEKEIYFGSNKTPSKGYIAQNPRLAIVKKGPLGMFDRVSGNFIGNYNADVYLADRPQLKTRYKAFIVGEDNTLLHDKSLIFTAKGAFGGSFGISYGEYQKQAGAVVERLTGKKFKNYAEFWGYMVFEFVMVPELKGAKNNSSWVSTIESVTAITEANLGEYYLGSDSDIKAKIHEAYEAEEDFGNFGKDVSVEEFKAAVATEPLPVERKPKNDAETEKLKSLISAEFDGGDQPDNEAIPF